MVSTKSSAIIFHSINSNRIVAVQEYGEFWGIPRGHIEVGETASDTIIRELYEECGINFKGKIEFIGSYMRSTFDSLGIEDGKQKKHISVYYGKVQNEIKLSSNDSAITKTAWKTLESLIELQINTKDRAFLTYCLEWLSTITSE